MFENVDGRTTDAGVTGILKAHLGAFGSGELIKADFHKKTIECKIYIIVQPKFGNRVILVGIFCQMKNPIKQG